MGNAEKDSLFLRYKKRFQYKRRLWNILSITYTVLLIPLMKMLDGTDYSMLWRIISIAVSAALIIQNFLRSRSIKKQLDGLSDNSAEKISAELECCKNFRSFYFTSEYLFSAEGIILPYYEIDEVTTKSYIGSPTATNIVFRTKSYGKCTVSVGLGYMNEDFYNSLMQKCPSADILFRCNYQKSDMDEYFKTVRTDSIIVIRNKQGGKF